jgi:hypothetical protein
MKYRETGSQNLMGSFLTQNTTQLIPVKKFNGAKANNTGNVIRTLDKLINLEMMFSGFFLSYIIELSY